MVIVNGTRSSILAFKVRRATNFWQRLLGLLSKDELYPGEGLLLEPCQGVHTYFMRFPIDVIYLDRELRVVRLVPDLAPFRLGPVVREASAVLELATGSISSSGTQCGDRLKLVPEDGQN